MAEVRHTDVGAFFQSLETVFNKAVQGASPVWNKIAMRIPSGGESNVYAWMEQLGGFREWIGPRLFEDIRSNGYTLVNRKFEKSVAVDKTKLDDDAYGIYGALVEQLAAAGAYHPDEMIGGLLDDGFSATCWDGKAFYAEDHPLRQSPDGNTTFSNVLTLPFNADNLKIAITQLRRNLSGGSMPFMGSFRPTVIVPADLEFEARDIHERTFTEFGEENIMKGMFDLVVLDTLTDTNQWHVHVTNNPIKPLIFQDREPLSVKTITDPNDSTVKETGLYKFMADYRGAFGYSLPILAIGSTGGN